MAAGNGFTGWRGHSICSEDQMEKIGVLRIELEGIEPLIWRRVAVRTGIKSERPASRHRRQ